MLKFEIWLDESGNFENDKQSTKQGGNPSLVGGLLVGKGSFPDSAINAILPEEGTYHSVEKYDQLDRLKKIEEKLFKKEFNRIVIFNNEECILILDNNLTYLNIISEGILQLIKHLKAEYGDIFLEIVIANRVDTTTGLDKSQSVVASDEYIKRLKEKLLIGSLNNSISEKEWKIVTASARKDKRLMLADIICNTYFTRNGKKKFSDEDREYISSIYDNKEKTLFFSALESALEKNFRDNLLENKIGEAVAIICESNNKKMLERCFASLKKNFDVCGVKDITFQYRFIEAYIKYYIDVVRDFDKCILFLNNLLEYYVPLLNEKENLEAPYAEKLSLDIKFYLLTVYTHTGNISKAEKLISKCEKEIENLPPTLDSVSYKLKYKTRKIINLINAFDFENALKAADEQIEKCREIKEMISIVLDEDTTYYDELAKALGTRLQIKTFLYRNQNSIYESAKCDSDEAIEEFVANDDKRRQYLYRVQLETERGNFDTAYEYLKKYASENADDDVKALVKKLTNEKEFAISAYVRLMAEASEWPVAEKMYSELGVTGYMTRLYEKDRVFYPAHIIMWKYAYYCVNHNSINSAIKYYEKAVELCFEGRDITINVIGLGILFEWYSMMMKYQPKEASRVEKLLIKKWRRIRENDDLKIVEKLFGDENFESKDQNYYFELSRRITY